ncbi:MAG: hypothetical protein LBT27_05850 [Prevotellaceae bacterium]|jgi:hypothetical protein|nr:hypothetical protein [Prevotellaceae bacterium]
MGQVHLLFANKTYDTAKQTVGINQLIQMNGYQDDRYVVYEILKSRCGLTYKLINLRTKGFTTADLIRPLSQKYGIGFYYDDENPRFMDAFEVASLRSIAEQIDRQKQEERQKQNERREKYTGGEGYFLGKSKYSGWIVKKETYYRDRESIINGFSLVAGDEDNICLKICTFA